MTSTYLSARSMRSRPPSPARRARFRPVPRQGLSIGAAGAEPAVIRAPSSIRALPWTRRTRPGSMADSAAVGQLGPATVIGFGHRPAGPPGAPHLPRVAVHDLAGWDPSP